MRQLNILACLLFSLSTSLLAQKSTINGYVEDALTGEKLIGANVFEKSSLKGTSTNVYGFYSLTLQHDTITIISSFVGYQPAIIKLRLKSDTTIKFRLEPQTQLKEVEISAERSENISERTRMSTIEIPIEQIKSLPVLLGEKDVLKIVQLMPGVQSGSEGNSGLYVRGGGADQNLILLDGVPVYNASHLFGFFSVFNTDAINTVELVKGGFPARYGGRLSSVLDIRMKEGNLKKYEGEASIGLISSRFTIEGPIKKEKSSFIFSARRTYIDWLARPLIKMASEGDFTAGYFFYDLNSKVNYQLSDKTRLYLSAYLGNDKAYAYSENTYYNSYDKIKSRSDSKLQWGNITTALRWNQLINKKMFSNTTLTYSKYKFDVGQSNENFNETNKEKSLYRYNYLSGIYDWGGKIDFDYYPSPAHYIKFGAGNTYHTFVPGVNAFKSTLTGSSDIDTTFGAKPIYGNEFYAYAEDDFTVTPRIKTNIGVHFSGFDVKKKTYYSIQPRVAARYLFSENTSIKASFSTMTQYLHLLTNGTIGLPTDLWVPVTDTIKPQNSKQYAAGIAQSLFNDFELSIEGYYKDMQNIIEYKEGASFFSTGTGWQQKVEFGKGWSYGAEILLQKKTGKFSGWIGYTLSWNYRQFKNLNFGEKFPYKYDRRHDIGVALSYKISENTDVGIVWVYGTGNAITFATERYLASPGLTGYGYYHNYQYEIGNFEQRNAFRMASYHRLDLGINKHQKKKHGIRTWSFGLYNAYNRRNPFYIYTTYNNSGKKVLKQVSIFPVLPSVSYSFKF